MHSAHKIGGVGLSNNLNTIYNSWSPQWHI